MFDLISRAIARVSSFLKGIQVKQFFAVAMVSFLLLTTNANPDFNNKGLGEKVRERAHQTTEGQRPRTTGEWEKEAAENAPLDQRVKDIAEDSVEAVKQWGKQYPDTARRSARSLDD